MLASEIADAEKVLAQYEPQIANSKRRADVDGSNFSITLAHFLRSLADLY